MPGGGEEGRQEEGRLWRPQGSLMSWVLSRFPWVGSPGTILAALVLMLTSTSWGRAPALCSPKFWSHQDNHEQWGSFHTTCWY